ncbi:Ferric-pseudobactin receptor precursor [compost metagenome]
MQSHSDTSGLRGSAANLFTWDRTGRGVFGDVSVNSHYTMRQSSVYGAARFQVSDQLKLITGARILSHDYRLHETWTGGDYLTATSEDGVVTPYFGAVYDINQNHSVYALHHDLPAPGGPRSLRQRVGSARGREL